MNVLSLASKDQNPYERVVFSAIEYAENSILLLRVTVNYIGIY